MCRIYTSSCQLMIDKRKGERDGREGDGEDADLPDAEREEDAESHKCKVLDARVGRLCTTEVRSGPRTLRGGEGGRERRGRTVGVTHAGLSSLQVGKLVDDLLDDALELAHLDLERREGLLVRDGAAEPHEEAWISPQTSHITERRTNL